MNSGDWCFGTMAFEDFYGLSQFHHGHNLFACGVKQSPTLGAHTHAHAHGFWVGMGAMLLFMGGHGCDIIVHVWTWVGIGFVHPCI
jgi:hypothetical protein